MSFRIHPLSRLPLWTRRRPNILDRWILSRQQTLIRRVNAEMDAYRLYTVVPAPARLSERADQLVRAPQPQTLLGEQQET